MSMETDIHNLPRKRTGRALLWIERQTLSVLALIGIVNYISVALFISIIEFFAGRHGIVLIASGSGAEESVISFWSTLYFNFVTILTVGYGEFYPVSFGRWLSVTEAFVGIGLLGVLVSVFTLKALMPPKNAIVFSRRAFYCTENERFLIVFVNTTNQRVSNVMISSYFKLAGDWPVVPPLLTPFITTTVQTFFINRIAQSDIIDGLREGDCLRVGVSAVIGFSNYSSSVQYEANEISVIKNRKSMIAFFEPRWNADLRNNEFQKVFHEGYETDAPTLGFAVHRARDAQSRTL